jgi:uncharacterized DUF497 family protein
LIDEIFEWDDAKATLNNNRHGVSFAEASTVFQDPYALTTEDPDHSEFEDRWVTVGLSLVSRILLVVHTYRNTRIRIISARKATAFERGQYETQR